MLNLVAGSGDKFNYVYRNISGSTLAFFFGGIFNLSSDETTLSVVTIPSQMFPELSLCVNGQETEYPFSGNAYESEYSKIDESGNI